MKNLNVINYKVLRNALAFTIALFATLILTHYSVFAADCKDLPGHSELKAAMGG